MSSIDKNVFTYISLDGVVMGMCSTHTVFLGIGMVKIVNEY